MKFRQEMQVKKIRRAKRTRAKLRGTSSRPRLSVHRTNRFIYAQLIDDTSMKTLAAISSDNVEASKQNKVQQAEIIGDMIGKKAKELGINKVIFDRGSYRYHGRVKALAEAARKSGLEF